MSSLVKQEEELNPVVPSQGIVMQEERPFYILCKPKLLPLKSVTLEKLEKMQENAQQKARQQMKVESENEDQLTKMKQITGN